MENNNWPTIIPLNEEFGPKFPIEALPDPLHNYAKALAETYQVPVDLPAMLMITSCAVPLAKHVQIKPGPEWIEPCNLYAAIVLPPASRKSAIFKEVTRPLEKYDADEAERLNEVISSKKQEESIIKRRISEIEKKAIKADGDDYRDLMKEADNLRKDLPEVPPQTRIIADDISPEKLANLLAEQNGRMAIFSAEGGIFDMINGKYSGGVPNLEVYLKGHAGDTLRVDRINRDSEMVNSPALTIGVTIQPDVIKDLALKPSLRGRGLLGRFIYILPSSNIGRRKIETSDVPPMYRAHYMQLFNRLFNMESFGELPSHLTLILAPEAKAQFVAFRHDIESKLAVGAKYENIQDWAGKLAGTVARIATILHMVTFKPGDTFSNTVLTETMRSAITLGQYFAEHALIAFDYMGGNKELYVAKRILEWVTHNRKEIFTARDAHQGLKGSIKAVTDIKDGLQLLHNHHYIISIPEEYQGIGQRPSPRYKVNPRIHPQNSQNHALLDAVTL